HTDVEANRLIPHVRIERAKDRAMHADVEAVGQVASCIETDERRSTLVAIAIERAAHVTGAELESKLCVQIELIVHIQIVDDPGRLDRTVDIESFVILQIQAVEHDPATCDRSVGPAEL